MVRNKIDSNFLYYYGSGLALDMYEVMGSHVVYDDNNKPIGCEFVVHAPNAKEVCVMGEWNYFNDYQDHMEKIDNSGIFYLYLEGNYLNQRYKYAIYTYDGQVLYKVDPYAFYSGLRPNKDSVVYDIEGYKWHDSKWRINHKKTYQEPMNIYEFHMGSWKRKGEGPNDFYNYREIAKMLVPYLKEFSYTHLEIMPIYEFPLDASWGYQGTGYYSANSRYGTPHDLMYLIDELHKANIGVIFDWVPGHICKDAHGLYMFDGTPLYEYPNEQDRENYEWGTANLDLGKGLVRSFLYSNALFFMKKYHVDGFRVDAVSNIIYWLGNKNRGVNEGACDFVRGLSNHIFKEDDRVLLIAEDSSDFPNVTKPTNIGGLGFNYKWDMGWMNDTLKYFKLDPIYRKYHHNQMTFSMAYFYNEEFLLPFSHDEVVHMKGSLLNKMPGDYWQKFANFRLLMGYQITHPGKKLTFMGSELAPFSEWAFYKGLDWNLLDYPQHQGANLYIKDINKMYLKEKALSELDYTYDGFKWIMVDNADQSIFVYLRLSSDFKEHLVVVLNCTPNTYHNYDIGVPGDYSYVELINSDAFKYGGSNQINEGTIKLYDGKRHNYDHYVSITIPPLGMTVLKMKKRPNRKQNVEKEEK